jgi:energy-coupling factor transport system permease protein
VPLFISAFARADRLALAMESRCYRGGEGRTRYRELRFGRGDALAALFTLLAFLAICGGPRLWPS